MQYRVIVKPCRMAFQFGSAGVITDKWLSGYSICF